MDFRLTDNLDLMLVDNIVDYNDDFNNETTVLQALFTDERENESRGYWLSSVLKSKLWIYDQAVINKNNKSSIELEANNILQDLVDEYFDSIDTNAFIEGNNIILNIKAYKNSVDPVLERNFKITNYD